MPSNSTTTPTPTAPSLVSRLEAGRMLGVSPGTVDNLRRRGELPSVKVAARRLFDVADLRAFIARAKTPTIAPGVSASASEPAGGSR